MGLVLGLVLDLASPAPVPDAHTHTHAHPYSYAHPDPDPDTHPDPYSYAHPDPHTHTAEAHARADHHTAARDRTGGPRTAAAPGPPAGTRTHGGAHPCPHHTRSERAARAAAGARRRALAQAAAHGRPHGPAQVEAAHEHDAAHHRARPARRSGAAAGLGQLPQEQLTHKGEFGMSQWLALVIAMVAVCAVVLGVVVLRQRKIAEDDDPSETPDVIEYMVMMIGVVYAIVLGLAIAGVWEGLGGAQADTLAEAQALHEVKSRVQVYPADVRDKIRADVDTYAAYVADKEWPYMRDHGDLSPKGTALLDQVRTDVTQFDPKSDLAAQAYQPVVDEVAAADEARASRGQNAGATMPGIVWFGLITGALVTVGLIFTLQIRHSARELLLAGLFSALIAFLLFLIWDLDAPFGSGLAVSADVFRDLVLNNG